MPLRPDQPRVVPIIGLLGGIASGKSFVGSELERLGCARVDADRIGHEVLQDTKVQQSLRQLFGPSIFLTEGEIDRRGLAALVFGTNAQAVERRKQLESLVHPLIHQRALAQIDSLKTADECPRAIVIDAPLLIEAGWTEVCDYVFFVDTADELRKDRAIARGWTVEQWRAREAAQASMEVKRQAATHIIPGNESAELLRSRLDLILNELQAKHPQ